MGGFRHSIAFVLVLAAGLAAAAAGAEENPALIRAFEIMRERGVIDEAEHAELVSKNQAWEASHPSLLSRFEWSGDFRGRLENFWYDEDNFDVDSEDRNRGRYRLRVGARAKVNEVVTGGFMLASGDFDEDGSGSGCENRSTNRSFGSGTDYNMDMICINQAWVELAMPKRFLPEGMALKSIVGKQVNPFVWRNGRDTLVWDNDITPEGVGLQVAGPVTDVLSLFGNAGYFIADENSGERDPHVFAVQAGLGLKVLENVETGARVSFYEWGSDTSAFQTTANSFGAVSLVDGGGAAIPNEYSVLEVGGYARFTHVENWPVLLYAQFAQNVDAESIPGAGKQDTGWAAGVEVGDRKHLVLIGAGYSEQEANFAPAQFTDSDSFDGFTNREGWLVYLGRELWPNTELNVTLFEGDAIDDDAIFAVPGAPSADRMRLQTDFLVKF